MFVKYLDIHCVTLYHSYENEHMSNEHICLELRFIFIMRVDTLEYVQGMPIVLRVHI